MNAPQTMVAALSIVLTLMAALDVIVIVDMSLIQNFRFAWVCTLL